MQTARRSRPMPAVAPLRSNTETAAPPLPDQQPIRSTMPSPPTAQPLRRWLLCSGWLAALFTLAASLGNGRQGQVIAQAFRQDLCESPPQAEAIVSRAQLAKLLTIPERSPQSAIREQLPRAYCQLAPLELRAEVTAQREAYPLAFDPQTWLILLFEEGEYAGYAFQFQS